MPDGTIKIKIDNKEYEVAGNQSILNACLQAGVDVPYYCYHEALSISGNCRMCLVLLEGGPKPVAACSMPVREGMHIITEHPVVKKSRELVSEMLLINHPLDCPVCDQAGECDLQNNSYKYAPNRTRFREEKNHKENKEFGPHVLYWAERCILCTRCIRFLNEISGTKELSVFKRGTNNVIDAFPGKVLNHEIASNVVDICPVGALVSADFLYKCPTWYMRKEYSICHDCSAGCHIRIDSFRNEIMRFKPFVNKTRKQYFICDSGRFNFEYITKNRIEFPSADGKPVSYTEAYSKAAEILKSGKNAVAVSMYANNETVYLAKKLAGIIKADGSITAFGKNDGKEISFPKFKIHADKNPNRKGASLILGKQNICGSWDDLAAWIEKNKPENLVLISGVPGAKQADAVVKKIKSLKNVIVIDFSDNGLTKAASVVIPTLTYAEKRGTIISEDGWLHRYNPAIDPVTTAEDETAILQKLINAVESKDDKVLSSSEVFNQLGQEISALKDISHKSLGLDGVKLEI